MSYLQTSLQPEVIYPDSDGQPTSENTEQFRWIVFIQQNLEMLFLYDANKNELSGWLWQNDRLAVIDPIDHWISPRLGIRFHLVEPEPQLFRPDGEPFTTLDQERQRVVQERQRAKRAEQRAARLAERLRAAGIDPDALE